MRQERSHEPRTQAASKSGKRPGDGLSPESLHKELSQVAHRLQPSETALRRLTSTAVTHLGCFFMPLGSWSLLEQQ